MATVRYTTVNGRVIAEKRGGVRKLYRPDHLGSTIALYDNTQTKTDTWVYWPYGAVRTRTGTTATPFQFVGVLGYFRDSSDRTYVRARFYRQTLGLWQTRDPLWPREPEYQYGSPVVATDATGRISIIIHGKYCGPQSNISVPIQCEKNIPFPPKDALDYCCCEHDRDWEQVGCDALSQIYNYDCGLATQRLCECAGSALCGLFDFDCQRARALAIAYACSAPQIVVIGKPCMDLATLVSDLLLTHFVKPIEGVLDTVTNEIRNQWPKSAQEWFPRK